MLHCGEGSLNAFKSTLESGKEIMTICLDQSQCTGKILECTKIGNIASISPQPKCSSFSSLLYRYYLHHSSSGDHYLYVCGSNDNDWILNNRL
ncbi:MAG: hypothetical protein MHPSP_002071 [Paramarteilia canceri]